MDSPFSQWNPTPNDPWDIVRVAHLYRRASFTPGWTTIQRSLHDSWEKSIDELFGLSKPQNRDNDLSENYEAQFEQMATTIGEAAVSAVDPKKILDGHGEVLRVV